METLDRELKVPRTSAQFRLETAHAQVEAQTAKSFLAVRNRPKLVLQTLGRPARRLKTLDREFKVSRISAQFRSEAAHGQAEAQSAKSFLAVWNCSKLVLQTLSRPASLLETLDRELKLARTSPVFRSEAAHAQAEAQTAKSFLAVWNRPKLVLQTLSRPASLLKTLDRELKLARTSPLFRSEAAHAQGEAQNAKSFLAVWNRPKLVLQTLRRPASLLKTLDRELKVPRTFPLSRSEAAHAQAEAQSANSFLVVWNRPKLVLQTLGRPASRLRTLDCELKVSRTSAQIRSEAAHAQAEAQSAKSFLAVWNRPKLVLQTLGRPAGRLKTLDRELKVSRTSAQFRSEAAHAQAEAQSAKSFLAVWNRPKLVLQTLGRAAGRLKTLDRELKVARTFPHFRSEAARCLAFLLCN